MLLQGQVGPQVLSDGTIAQARQGKLGEMSVSELQARYYEQAYRGNVFFASATSVTFTAQALTTTSGTGLAISNPAASKKNLVPIQAEMLLTGIVANTNTLFTAGVMVTPYSATAITNTTGATIYNALGPATTGAGSVATGSVNYQLPVAPVLFKAFYSAAVTSTTFAGAPGSNIAQALDFGGSIIIAPGSTIVICGTLADTGHVTMTWMEVPI